MPNYWPYNQYKGDYDSILDHLEADIICIQESKVTRKQVPRRLAIPTRYDAFLSCYRRQPVKGYSGTAVFTKKSVCVPLKAEEGLSGVLQSDDPKIPTSAYVDGHPSDEQCAALGLDAAELRDLDCEGRVTVVDLGLFVLISIYSPNLTNEARGSFKDYFNLLTEARVRALIQAGREVVVAGDLNICSQEIDHADPYKNLPKDGSMKFTDTRPRQWFNAFIGENGLLIDVCRKFNPTKTGMYTCWETRIDARSSNYGTRIDYVLVTPGLLPWIQDSQTLPQVKGSDHCPVYVDFHDSITTEDGRTLHLWDQINPSHRTRDGPTPDPPAFAGRFWPEFAHKLLSSFFGGKSNAEPQSVAPSPRPTPSRPAGSVPLSPPPPSEAFSAASTDAPPKGASQMASSSKQTIEDSSDDDVVQVKHHQTAPKEPQRESKKATPASSGQDRTTAARKATSSSSSSKLSSKSKGRSSESDSQKTLASFFAPPASTTSKSPSTSKKRKSSETQGVQASPDRESSATVKSKSRKRSIASSDVVVLEDIDPEEQQRVEAAIREGASSGLGTGNSFDTSKAWSSLFQKQPAPLCKGHSEPCKELMTTKPGPNKGRMFWLCARPKGPNDDKSGEFQCDHFEFSTRVNRPYLVGGDGRK